MQVHVRRRAEDVHRLVEVRTAGADLRRPPGDEGGVLVQSEAALVIAGGHRLGLLNVEEQVMGHALVLDARREAQPMGVPGPRGPKVEALVVVVGERHPEGRVVGGGPPAVGEESQARVPGERI